MITMYAVANIDSALWGTRSVGDVTCTSTTTATDSDTDTDTDSGDNGEVAATRSPGGNSGGDDGITMREFDFSRGEVLVATTAPKADEEEAVPHERPGTDAPKVSGDGGYGREASEGEGKRGGWFSLKASKFIILALWVLVNVGVTLAYSRWRLYTLALFGFFSQIAGMAVFVAAAWVEMRLQCRAALPPSSPPPKPTG